MNPERWNKIKELFSSAYVLSVAERSEFLGRACGDDHELRSEVEKLIDSHEEEDLFMQNSAVAEVAGIIGSDLTEGMGNAQSAHATKQLAPATVINDRYEIVRLLGRGGMGEVYLALDNRINRNVALKLIPPDMVSSQESLTRFAREAQAVSALNHPHIMTIYEFDRMSDGSLFFAAEYIDGQTLNRLVGEKLKPSEILGIAIQVSSALTAAHNAGMVHRDIKPENIMVRRDGYVKVLDFGLAKLNQAELPSTGSGSEDPTRAMVKTRPGIVMGTAAYMSPEQARGLQVDARTDVWSLGAVIYEMLTGRRPFLGETTADTIVSVLSREPPPISFFVKESPGDLQILISKALSKNIEARFQSSEEMRAELERVKKRIEFNEDLNRAKNADGRDPENRLARSLIHGSVLTAGDVARRTIGGHDTSPPAHSFWHSTAISGVLRQVQTHKAGSAVAAAIFFFVISTAFYFIIAGTGSGGQIDSIAVLPFENLSGAPELNYVSDGLSERLIDRLAELPQLRVISRSSSFKFRGKDLDLRDVASQLGVRAIVTGTIAQVGEDLLIRYDIVDTADDRHLGGGQYRRKAGEIVDIQNEIAQVAAGHLHLGLTDMQSKRLSENTTENSEAFRYYLNGLVELNGPQEVSGKALKYFQKAVELDPEFAAARVEIAGEYWNSANGAGDPEELMPKVKAEVERALAIDPNLAKAHALRAAVLEYDFDWKGAEDEYKRAVELSPNHDFVRNNYAFFLSIMGRHEEALAQLEEQKRRDPLNEWMALMHKAVIYSQSRRFDEALATNQEAKELDPNRDLPNYALGYAYGGKGMRDQAVAYYQRSVERIGGEQNFSMPLMFLAATYAKMPERRDDAWKILRRTEASNEYASPTLLAMVYSALGDNDKAIELLELAYEKHDVQLRFIGIGYEFDDLRADPRFRDLIRRLNLPG
jgi:serine/threonine protein kinase/TolB-like protein/Tfp pilus assembly protein PilF